MANERRESYRFPARSTDGVAILRNQGVDLMVALAEESSGGFGVVTAKPVPLKVGEELGLATEDGNYIVRVCHVTETDGQTRIGLKRVRDVDFLPTGRVGLKNLRHCLLSPAMAAARLLVAAACLAAFVAGFLLAPNDWLKGATAPAAARMEMPPLAHDFERLLVSERFATSLALTDEQRRRIDDVVGRTTTRMSTLFITTPPESRNETAIQIIRASWEQVQDVLTDEQKHMWDALLVRASRRSRS